MSDWPEIPIKDVATVKGGKRLPKGAELSERRTPFPYVRVTDVKDGCVATQNVLFVPSEVQPRIARYTISKDDVFISIVGTVGLVARIPEELSGANLTENAAKISCDPEKVDHRYLRYFLQSKPGQDAVRAQTVGSTQPKLALFRIGDIKFPCPDMATQSQIADVLSVLDHKIELNRQMNETLEAMAQAIFRDWFLDFGPTRRKIEGASDPVEIMGGLVTDAVRAQQLADLFPAGFGDNGLPERWAPGSASNLVEFNPKEPLRKGMVAPYTDMASLPTAGLIAEGPVHREFGSGMRFRNGDALLARITPCLENGKAAFVDFLPDEQVGWGSTEFFVLRAKDGVPPPFCYLLVRLPEFRAVAIASMTGTSGRQRAQIDRLEAFPMARPDKSVLMAFGSFVEPIFEKISANGEENRTLGTTRDLLLPNLLSGEIRIREAEERLEAAQ